MAPERIRETKRTLDGRTQSFDCLALSLSSRLAVVRFDHTGARDAGGFFFPAGSHTLGYFWSGRAYNCYRFAGPDGAVIAYRFDVVDRVRIVPGHVSYRDLLLDLWVSTEGVVQLEDEDEVAAARTSEALGPAQWNRIERTRALLLRDHRRIIAEVESVASRLSSG